MIGMGSIERFFVAVAVLIAGLALSASASAQASIVGDSAPDISLLAAEDIASEIRNCPCPSENQDFDCGDGFCGTGLLFSISPGAHSAAYGRLAIFRDDRHGLTFGPDPTPPRAFA